MSLGSKELYHMPTVKIKRLSIQQPLYEGVIPYVAAIFVEVDGISHYKVGVGMTPESAIKDLADRTSLIVSIPLVDWHKTLRSIAFPEANLQVIPEDVGDVDDLPF